MKLTRNILPFFSNIINKQYRDFCSQETTKYVRKYVYISQSTDIYTNLALEDWIYTNVDFDDKEILMLWQNRPCVVIGRHQNPWLEANVPKLASITKNGIDLARRNSGGGTVYHDEGNLNMTFFTARNKYNRKHNLEIITKALLREYRLKVDISKREDLVAADYKVSGTASKLGRNTAYHHCTLLINANRENLHQALQTTCKKLKTRATRSVKSPILNLQELNSNVTVDSALRAIGFEYQHSPGSPVGKKSSDEIILAEGGFRLVNPTEVWFQGINQIRDNLSSWDWIFGKCPQFSVLEDIEIADEYNTVKTFNLEIIIESGRISDIKLMESSVSDGMRQRTEEVLVSSFKNQEYSEENVDKVSSLAKKVVSDMYSIYKDEAVNR